MQHVLYALAGFMAGVQITNVAFNEGKTAPGFRPDDIAHHIKIFLVAGQKVVQPDDCLPKL